MNKDDAYARLKAAVAYTTPRYKNARVSVRAEDIEAALAEIDVWRTTLSRVMPLECREWHDSGPSEWPTVAAQMLLSLREQVRNHAAAQKPLTSAQIRSIEVEVAQSRRNEYHSDAEAFARAIERAHGIE